LFRIINGILVVPGYWLYLTKCAYPSYINNNREKYKKLSKLKVDFRIVIKFSSVLK
jgi:FAD synthase